MARSDTRSRSSLVTTDTTDRLYFALLRESLDLVERGVATPADIDAVVKTTIGRRLSVGGPIEIWEQIGWDLVQTIAGELYREISNASKPPANAASQLTDYSAQEKISPKATSSDGSDGGTLFKKIAVVGAGLMGHGIALEFAAHGYQVALYDLKNEILDEAKGRVEVGLRALASAGRIDEAEVQTASRRITTDTVISRTVAGADLVIEAATENLELKLKIFDVLDRLTPPETPIVSNSSTFLPSAYGSATKRPALIAGVHYYNPPHLLPGVELIRSSDTDDAVIDSLDRFYRSIAKNPAHIHKEMQGFVGNRLQVAVLREAFQLIGSGEESADSLDSQVRDSLGTQLAEYGPFGIAVERGVDSVLREASDVFPTLCDDRELPPVLVKKIESSELGVKVRKGFYEWSDESAEAWRKNMADSLLKLATAD